MSVMYVYIVLAFGTKSLHQLRTISNIWLPTYFTNITELLTAVIQMGWGLFSLITNLSQQFLYENDILQLCSNNPLLNIVSHLILPV